MVNHTIEQLWLKSGKRRSLKVRYRDWNYKIRFFTIDGYSPDKKRLIGKLDNGEIISYCIKSDGWMLYHEGCEEFARAV